MIATRAMRSNLLMVAAAMVLQSVGGFFLNVAPTSMVFMRVSGIESTPNPSSFKFDLDETLHRYNTYTR